MLTLTATVTFGGHDVSNYVVSIERTQSICDPNHTGTVELSFECDYTPDPYDTVVIEELGTKVFTGYVTNVSKERMSPIWRVEVSDPVIRLADYWLDTSYESGGETAQYWIGFFCDLAGVDYQFDVSYAREVPAYNAKKNIGFLWQYTSALEVIQNLMLIGGYYMVTDADGTLHFTTRQTGNAPENLSTGDNILAFRREQTLDPTRNKSIVFGKYPIVASATTTVTELGTRVKTAVVATHMVETQSYAQTLADKMMAYFQSLGDIKTVEVLPNPSFAVGQAISVSESWTGYSSSCLITSLRSSMTNSGYTMTLILDEMCPYIWGYALLEALVLYASTDGNGVWRSDDLGVTWYDITGNISGEGLYVRGISAHGDLVWASTLGGLYKTTVGGNTWTLYTPDKDGTPVDDWTDIEIDPDDDNAVYALCDVGYTANLFKTGDAGSSWDYVEIG